MRLCSSKLESEMHTVSMLKKNWIKISVIMLNSCVFLHILGFVLHLFYSFYERWHAFLNFYEKTNPKSGFNGLIKKDSKTSNKGAVYRQKTIMPQNDIVRDLGLVKKSPFRDFPLFFPSLCFSSLLWRTAANLLGDPRICGFLARRWLSRISTCAG